MPTSALDAYQSAQRGAATNDRQLEATLLFQAARQLEAVARSWDGSDRPLRLREALTYNTRLWSIFQAAMEDPANPLSQGVRVNVLQLVRFIDRRTLEILATPGPERLQPLIDINRQIAMGLSAVAPGAQAAPTSAISAEGVAA